MYGERKPTPKGACPRNRACGNTPTAATQRLRLKNRRGAAIQRLLYQLLWPIGDQSLTLDLPDGWEMHYVERTLLHSGAAGGK